MKKAQVIMVPRDKVITLKPDDNLRDAVRTLALNKVSGAPVVEEGRVEGVLSESDILRFFETSSKKKSKGIAENPEIAGMTAVRSIMSKKVVSVGPEASLGDIARIMSDRKVNRVVVADKQMALLGLITRADVIKAGLEELQ